METTIKIYSYKPLEIRAYIFSLVFISGNIALPQLAHTIPMGGVMFLPIYFFTLIAAYKYGWLTGMLVAIASPLVNNTLFGMPMSEVLPIILIKSSLLAIGASFIASKSKELSFFNILLIIVFYQGLGTIAEFWITGSWQLAFQDVMIGYPGILLQLIGCFYLLRTIRNW